MDTKASAAADHPPRPQWSGSGQLTYNRNLLNLANNSEMSSWQKQRAVRSIQLTVRAKCISLVVSRRGEAGCLGGRVTVHRTGESRPNHISHSAQFGPNRGSVNDQVYCEQVISNIPSLPAPAPSTRICNAGQMHINDNCESCSTPI